LLGQLTGENRERFEQRLFVDDDLFEELVPAEDELIDQYLDDDLSKDEAEMFRNHFLITAERQQKLRFAKVLRGYAAAHPAERQPYSVDDKGFDKQRRVTGPTWMTWRQLFSTPALRLAAFAIVVLIAGFGIWRIFFHQSEVDKGLLALNAAYREQRPVESRISALSYAPYATTRGPESDRVNQTDLRRAELTVLDALNTKPTAAVHHALGEVYLAKKQFDDAIKELDEALKGDPKNARLYSDLGAAYLEKGKLDREGKEPGKDLEDLGHCLENLNKALELNPNLLEALFNRALLYQRLMTTRQAEDAWREYIQKDSDSPWVDEARRNLKRLEESELHRSHNGDALNDFLEARRAGADDAAWRVLGQSYTSAGNEVTNKLVDCLLDPGTSGGLNEPLPVLSYVATLESSRTGERYTSDLIDQYRRARPDQKLILADAVRYMKTGYALFTQSRYAEAVHAYSQARRKYEQVGDSTEEAFVDYRLAHCYLFLPDLAKADKVLKQLSTLCDTRVYRWLLAQCLYCLSHASADNNQYSKALDYSERALIAFERVNDHNGVVKSLTQLADINQSLSRIDKSLHYLSRGLRLSNEVPTDPMQTWGILVQMAFSMSSKQLNAAALAYQKEALQIAIEMNRPLLISRSSGYVGTAYAALKMYAQAADAVNKAFDVGMSMAEGSGGLEITANALQQIGDITREAGDCARAIAFYDRSVKLYEHLHVEYYNYFAHKGKLQCLIAGDNKQAAGEELQTVLSLAAQNRSNISDEGARLSFFDAEQSVYDQAIYFESAQMNAPLKAFDLSEASRARSLYDEIHSGAQVQRKGPEPAIKLPPETPSFSLSEIRQRMPADAQILQYAVLDDRVLMWIVTRSAIETRTAFVSAAQLTDDVRGYLEFVNHPPGSEVSEQIRRSKHLYRLLISPIEDRLDKNKYLCIVPDKILHYLPYQALISPASSSYMIENYNLGYAPSSSIFVTLSESAQHKAGRIDERMVSVGDPLFSRKDFDMLADLPAAASEAETASSFYQKRIVLLREEATESRLRAELESADVVHLATHYVLNERLATLSGFPLAPEHSNGNGSNRSDGFLQAYEIYVMNLPRTRLVVLSGCQTGIEQEYKGEGPISAARPFLVAKVPTVVATQWAVDSDASAGLMASFHQHRVRDQLPVTQALRRAQIDMALGPDLRYRNPYYWAAFVSIGGQTPY